MTNAASTETARPSGAWMLALAGLIAVAAVLRFHGLAEQGAFFQREATFVEIVRGWLGAPGGEATVAAGARDVVWSAVVACVLAVTGPSAEWAGRVAAAVCGLALIPVSWRVGRLWFGDAAGAFALAAICALLPSLVWWSRLGLPAMLALVCAFGGLLALLRCFAGSRTSYAETIGAAVAFAVAVLADASMLPVAVAAAIWFTAMAMAQAERRRAAGAVFLFIASFVAALLVAGAFGAYRNVSPEVGLGSPDVFYWLWQRDGAAVCLLGGVGVFAASRLDRPRAGLLALLFALPMGWGIVFTNTARGVPFPFLPVYVAIALLAGGGLHALLTMQRRALAITAGAVALSFVLAQSAPLMWLHSGARESGAYLAALAPAEQRGRHYVPAVAALARPARPYADAYNRGLPRLWWADPAEEVHTLYHQHGAYVVLVGEAGHRAWRWDDFKPLQVFPRRVPRAALFVSEGPGTPAEKRERFRAGMHDRLAAYDIATVAAGLPHEHDEPPPAFAASLGLGAPPRFPVPDDAALFDEWRVQFRAALRDVLGMENIPRTEELHARVTDETNAEQYIRERVELESEPGTWVPAFVLRPEQRANPPVVLFLHGHGPGKSLLAGVPLTPELAAMADEYGDVAGQLVRRGYAVIIPDQRGFGELMHAEDVALGLPYSCPRLQPERLAAGRTLIGERVHDTMRWIDYARQRADLDASRIIVAGHSAGGTTALFTAALDERVETVFVSGYFGTWADTIGRVEQCVGNYVPGIARLGELSDIAALVAPRRLRISAGRLDADNPFPALERAFADVRRAYSRTGGTADLAVGPGGHLVYPEHLWPLLAPAPPT